MSQSSTNKPTRISHPAGRLRPYDAAPTADNLRSPPARIPAPPPPRTFKTAGDAAVAARPPRIRRPPPLPTLSFSYFYCLAAPPPPSFPSIAHARVASLPPFLPTSPPPARDRDRLRLLRHGADSARGQAPLSPSLPFSLDCACASVLRAVVELTCC